MERIYVVTGASGHLGNVVVRQLVAEGRRVWTFLLKGERNLVEGVDRVFYGDVRDLESLESVFRLLDGVSTCIIHCAGVVSIKSQYSPMLREVNVLGTMNVVDLCIRYGVSKLVYVSSVHAIPDNKAGEVLKEIDVFDPDTVIGYYAKSKAEATAYVVKTCQGKLDFNVVHPSGIIGPYDYGNGHLTTLVRDYCTGRLVAGMTGGYDFVDVRDVANGIVKCTELGAPGAFYLLTNDYYPIPDLMRILSEVTGKRRISTFLPLWLVKITAPLAELYYTLRKQSPLYTAYSIYTLTTDNRYSHAKADAELGYTTRPMEETLKDTYEWLKDQGRVK
jgi:dihydroflavonol-4-reductase